MPPTRIVQGHPTHVEPDRNKDGQDGAPKPDGPTGSVEPSSHEGPGMDKAPVIPSADIEIGVGRPRDVRAEAHPGQILRAVHLDDPTDPMPPQEQSEAAERGETSSGAPIEDVKVSPGGPSVWEG